MRISVNKEEGWGKLAKKSVNVMFEGPLIQEIFQVHKRRKTLLFHNFSPPIWYFFTTTPFFIPCPWFQRKKGRVFCWWMQRISEASFRHAIVLLYIVAKNEFDPLKPLIEKIIDENLDMVQFKYLPTYLRVSGNRHFLPQAPGV